MLQIRYIFHGRWDPLVRNCWYFADSCGWSILIGSRSHLVPWLLFLCGPGLSSLSVTCYVTYPRERQTHVSSFQIGQQQEPKESIPPKSSLVKQRIYWGLLIGSWVTGPKAAIESRSSGSFGFCFIPFWMSLSTSMSVFLTAGFWKPRNHHALVVCREANMHCFLDE